VDPGKGSRLVEEIRSLNPQLKAFAFLNRAGPREVDNQEAGDYLADNEALSFLTG
jgi:chromosome partitioning protein